MEHDIPFGNSNRENGPTFLDFPLFLGIFQWDEPTKRVPFTAEPEIPQILTKRKAPHVSGRPPVAKQGSQWETSHFRAQYGNLQPDIAHPCWGQPTAVKTRFLSYLMAGSVADPLRLHVFLKLASDKLLVFNWLQAQV